MKAVRNQQLATSNQQLATSNQQLATSNLFSDQASFHVNSYPA
jgi:hypothetical protein